MKNVKREKTGKFSPHANWVKRVCINCGIIFSIKESALKYGRGKCCSRKCVDENKKKNVGVENPMFGKHQTKEQREKSKLRAMAMWRDKGFRRLVDEKRKKYKEKHGYAMGASPTSIAQRKSTFLKKYGVEHNWMVKEIRKKCEDTCIKLYGKHSWEFAYEAMENKETLIEMTIRNILESKKINFIPYYKVYTTDNKYKEYDFYLPEKNVLIEADGDYWHGNPTMFSENSLNEAQIKNRNNDTQKNVLAKTKNIRLLRYWENEITNPEFKSRLLADIRST